jgi:hypothetical protein
MFKVLILVASLIATPAFAGSYFKYIDDSGTICLVDDIERVPEKYFNETVEITWEELKASVEKRWTPMNNKENKVE